MKGALGPIDELDPEHYLSQWRDVARPMPVLRSGVGLESADTRRRGTSTSTPCSASCTRWIV